MRSGNRSSASWRSGRLACSIIVATLAGTFASTSLSTAAVPNIELHRSTSANTSLSKSTVVACPSGRTLTGVGGDITGATGAVLIDDLEPNTTRTQNTVTGNEIGSPSGNWFLHSYAICASPLAGATRVTASTATNDVDGKSVTASCPAGTRLTGAAGRINGGFGNVVMDDLRPVGNPATSVTVTGFEVNPDTSWSATAFALCANPLVGQVTVTAISASNSSNKSITVSCPAGRKVTGLGGEIAGASGEVVINAYRPNELLSAVTVTAVEALDLDGAFTGTWTVRAYAVCATP
jgi:hypothetical protein